MSSLTKLKPFKLKSNIKSFFYKGKLYKGGMVYEPFDECDMKEFLIAGMEVNRTKSLSKSVKQLYDNTVCSTGAGSSQAGSNSANEKEKNEVFEELDKLKLEFQNFGSRLRNMGKVRLQYVKSTNKYFTEIKRRIKNGQLPPEKASIISHRLRNFLMHVQRKNSMDLGKAIAIFLKKRGYTYDELLNKYAGKLFHHEFKYLSELEKVKVFEKIVEKLPETRGWVTRLQPYISKLGSGLVISSYASMLYNIYVAENKIFAALKEAAMLISGTFGAYLGGKAGLMCSPIPIAVPFCVGIGIIGGGYAPSLIKDKYLSGSELKQKIKRPIE